VRAAKALVELGHDSYEWLLFQGRLLARAGRFQAAIDRYTAAVAAAPTNTNAYDERAGVFVCMGAYSRALEDYTWAHHLDADKGSVWRHYKRATPTWMLGELEQAAADYRTVRARLGRVSHADARLFLVLQDRARRAEEAGEVEVAQRIREEANQVLRDGLDKVVPESWLETVLQCLAGERTPAALVDLALTKRPSGLERLCEANYYAGEGCLLHGQVEEAQKLFRSCMDTGMTFDPDSSSLDPMNEYHLARWRLAQLGGQAETPSE
jgi:tetratricopeptide (TPR) repeat protein